MSLPGRTGRRSRLSGRARLFAVAAAVAVGLASCGGGTSPVEAVPALGDRLAQVDEAVAGDDPARAATAVEALRRLVVEAQRSGDLSDAQAEAVLDAADELLRRLEGAEDDRAPAPEPTPEEESSVPTPEEAPEEPEDEGVDAGEDEGEDDGEDEDEGEGHDDGKGHGKGKKHPPGKGHGKGKGHGN